MPNAAAELPPLLHEGDRLDAQEFLRRWEAMPELKRAELIDGVVFMASPVSMSHGNVQVEMGAWLIAYKDRTPGCQAGSDTTWVMEDNYVPQPDLYLRILPAYGGQSHESGAYGAGAPELIVEVSGSSVSRDLGAKLESYRSAGVREYITVQLSPHKITWRQLVSGRYRKIEPDADGLIRSVVFPGLWLDPATVWAGGLTRTAALGTESPEHAAFVKRLAAAARRRKA